MKIGPGHRRAASIGEDRPKNQGHFFHQGLQVARHKGVPRAHDQGSVHRLSHSDPKAFTFFPKDGAIRSIRDRAMFQTHLSHQGRNLF